MKKAKRYAEGGPTAQGSYPFPQSLSGASNASPLQPSNTNVFVGGQGAGQAPFGGLPQQPQAQAMKKGGAVKKMARGGGIEQRGKTRGRMV